MFMSDIHVQNSFQILLIRIRWQYEMGVDDYAYTSKMLCSGFLQDRLGSVGVG